jgi:lipopolysaccharide transport system ATP-binding protein
MSVVIKVENLSKAYQLGEIGTGTISRDLERFWARIRGKEDPFLKIGEVNDRSTKGTSNIVWGLKDLNFEIEQGAAVGIIGRNGAGKSTLLKILSRVTSPTTGSVKIKGRVASLLEVGTGFHPELSGRENIFLNGAILGMRKAEIKRKFDEMVDFSGVERYIDTPVKRYSSGMYVRLAFAVAAHLESEILIVDEVLSVGDAEFQKKCLGKMGDVSKGEGRTVLFVSHNLEAVKNLCNTGLLLQNGMCIYSGNINTTVNNYIKKFSVQETEKIWLPENAPGNNNATLLLARVSNPLTGSTTDFNTASGFVLELVIDNLIEKLQQLDITYHLVDERGILVKVASTGFVIEPRHYGKGRLTISSLFPGNILNQGTYSFTRVLLVKDRGHVITEWNNILSFDILPISGGELGWQGEKEGVLKLDNLEWKITTTQNES